MSQRAKWLLVFILFLVALGLGLSLYLTYSTAYTSGDLLRDTALTRAYNAGQTAVAK